MFLQTEQTAQDVIVTSVMFLEISSLYFLQIYNLKIIYRAACYVNRCQSKVTEQSHYWPTNLPAALHLSSQTGVTIMRPRATPHRNFTVRLTWTQVTIFTYTYIHTYIILGWLSHLSSQTGVTIIRARATPHRNFTVRLTCSQHLIYTYIYTIQWSKKWYQFYFCNNFQKFTPILTTISLLDQEICGAYK